MQTADTTVAKKRTATYATKCNGRAQPPLLTTQSVSQYWPSR